jgi:hypothetical protein
MRITRSPDKRGRYIMLPLGIGVAYAEKNGGAVLKCDTHWTKINSIWLNTKWGCYWFIFRRDWRKNAKR